VTEKHAGDRLSFDRGLMAKVKKKTTTSTGKGRAREAGPGASRKSAGAKGAARRKTSAPRTSPQRSSPVVPPRGKLERVRLPATAAKRRGVAPAADDGLKYVYCVIKSERPLSFGPLGIGADPAEVHTVHFRDIAAVVSNTPMVVQDPTRDNVLAHQRVNETVMQQHTVIPMSFGTVFKTDDDIMELLRSAYEAFLDVLTKMQDKFEFGLKVLWDRDQIIREIEEEDEDIRRLKGEISSQKGSTYFARMQYGRMIDSALQARSERYAADIFEALRDVSVASRSNKPIGDRMIMNAAFLVTRAREEDFDMRVKDIGLRYDKLTFKYTGPWPPYNFVNIRLKLERAH
jgi:hypothetical protein